MWESIDQTKRESILLFEARPESPFVFVRHATLMSLVLPLLEQGPPSLRSQIDLLVDKGKKFTTLLCKKCFSLLLHSTFTLHQSKTQPSLIETHQLS